MDKTGQLGEQIMVFVFIFFMVIIGAGIVIGTGIFLGPEFDFRGSEAVLMNYKVRNCLLDGELKGIDNLASMDDRVKIAYNKCGFNAKVMEGGKHLIKICNLASDDVRDCIRMDGILSTGGDFTPCGFPEKEKNKFIGCSIEKVVKGNENYIVLTASKQNTRRSAR